MILKERINPRLIFIYLLICVSVFQSGVDFQLSMFIYYTPKYQCQVLDKLNDTLITADNCFYYKDVPNPEKKSCQNWTFDTSDIKSTFVTDMLLICDRQYLQLILVPLRNLGGAFAVFLGLLSDYFGRKKIYTACCLLDTLIWILIAVVPLNYVVHAFLRFFKLFGIGSSIIGFVLVTELTPKKYRNFFVINYWTFFSIGLATCPVYVKYMPTWRWAWLLATWPMCLNLLVPFILLESPRWLIVNNRKEEAKQILQQLDQYISENGDNGNNENEEVDRIKEAGKLCTSLTLMSRLGVLLLTTWSFFIVYQGTSTNLEFAVSNIYINAVVMGLIEIPAGPLGYLSNKYFGGITSVVWWTFAGMASYALIPDNWNTSIATSTYGMISRSILASLSKFFLILAWNVSGIFYVYLFPTNKRNFISNLSEITGFVGGALGGFIGYYYQGNGTNNTAISISNIIYGAVLAIAIILFGLVIPPVDNIELPNTIEEAEKIKKTPLCCSDKCNPDAKDEL